MKIFLKKFFDGAIRKEDTDMAKEKSTTTETSHDSEVIIRNYPSALCRERTSKRTGGKFHTLSFMFQDAWASIVLPPDSVSSSREGKVDIKLGKEDDIRIASIADGDSYRPQPFFAKSVKSIISANRLDYLKSVAI